MGLRKEAFGSRESIVATDAVLRGPIYTHDTPSHLSDTCYRVCSTTHFSCPPPWSPLHSPCPLPPPPLLSLRHITPYSTGIYNQPMPLLASLAHFAEHALRKRMVVGLIPTLGLASCREFTSLCPGGHLARACAEQYSILPFLRL